MPIKAITFDFWQTLYSSKPVDFKKRIRQLQGNVEQAAGLTLEPARFEGAVKVARDTWNRTWIEDHRTLNAGDWLAIILQQLRISLDPGDQLRIQTELENRILTETPHLTSEAPAVLADLSARYHLAIISDTGIIPGRALRQILAGDGLMGFFSHLTFSDEIGHSKPHPKAFLITLAALDVKPADSIHVGDLLRTDIAGAQNVGMRGVQYTGLNHNGWPKTTDQAAVKRVSPDAVIGRHTELKSLLQRWNNSA